MVRNEVRYDSRVIKSNFVGFTNIYNHAVICDKYISSLGLGLGSNNYHVCAITTSCLRIAESVYFILFIF